ncbi:MAG: hypothetical protein M1828_005582 [Chrysothrix sp. TS-e1954]|nr:MAG: hypothetical protein M1828_005582 [Chrysothrix sp. TS-e1954]
MLHHQHLRIPVLDMKDQAPVSDSIKSPDSTRSENKRLKQNHDELSLSGLAMAIRTNSGRVIPPKSLEAMGPRVGTCDKSCPLRYFGGMSVTSMALSPGIDFLRTGSGERWRSTKLFATPEIHGEEDELS